MLRTPFTELFGLEAPVLQAPIWPGTSPELVAAVAEGGGIGSIGAVFAGADSVRAQIGRVRALTDRPFIVNHVVPVLDEDAFAATLEARPAAVSFALGDPGDLVRHVHDAGLKAIQQVHTVAQARAAADLNVEVIIAQGSEAGGQGLVAGPSVMTLVPQVVDAVAPTPVLAAGGIADGRGLAAALALGGAGANVGTRFRASDEAGVARQWKDGVLASDSEDVVRFETWSAFMPTGDPRAYATCPRVMRTDFVAEWEGRAHAAAAQADALLSQVLDAMRAGRAHEILPFMGQSAGLIEDVRPAADIVRAMAAGAERVLGRAVAPAAG